MEYKTLLYSFFKCFKMCFMTLYESCKKNPATELASEHEKIQNVFQIESIWIQVISGRVHTCCHMGLHCSLGSETTAQHMHFALSTPPDQAWSISDVRPLHAVNSALQVQSWLFLQKHSVLTVVNKDKAFLLLFSAYQTWMSLGCILLQHNFKTRFWVAAEGTLALN